MLMHELGLPQLFCWTRMGAESGESLGDIVARKEAERVACGGVFYWGIGSSVGPALSALLCETDNPEILFSPIKSPARLVDASPSHVARWSAGRGLFGNELTLPPTARVTSRWDPARPQAPRYALVCASESPLVLSNRGEICTAELRNLRSGAPIGASQVTAVVRHHGTPTEGGSRSSYPVTLRASLVWPFLIRLADPAPVDQFRAGAPGLRNAA